MTNTNMMDFMRELGSTRLSALNYLRHVLDGKLGDPDTLSQVAVAVLNFTPLIYDNDGFIIGYSTEHQSSLK